MDDLRKFARVNGINYTEKEVAIMYDFIMKNYEELLNENIRVFEKIKNKISPTLYKSLLNLYIEYKQKYF